MVGGWWWWWWKPNIRHNSNSTLGGVELTWSGDWVGLKWRSSWELSWSLAIKPSVPTLPVWSHGAVRAPLTRALVVKLKYRGLMTPHSVQCKEWRPWCDTTCTSVLSARWSSWWSCYTCHICRQHCLQPEMRSIYGRWRKYSLQTDPVMNHLLVCLHSFDVSADAGSRGSLHTSLVNCVLAN